MIPKNTWRIPAGNTSPWRCVAPWTRCIYGSLEQTGLVPWLKTHFGASPEGRKQITDTWDVAWTAFCCLFCLQQGVRRNSIRGKMSHLSSPSSHPAKVPPVYTVSQSGFFKLISVDSRCSSTHIRARSVCTLFDDWRGRMSIRSSNQGNLWLRLAGRPPIMV